MNESKRKLVIGIVSIGCIAIIFVVAASLMKKVAVGPDRPAATVGK